LNKTGVEVFRAKLQNILDSIEGDKPYERGVKAVVRALKIDYDILFPERVWQTGQKALQRIHRLIKEHCYQNEQLCPICGILLKMKTSRAGKHFLGCQQYPLCQGSRSIEGSPTINNAMKEFLSQKVNQEELIAQKQNNNRFRNLDL